MTSFLNSLWNSVIEYETPRLVKIHNRKLGLVRRLIQLGIILYVGIYALWLQKGYQEFGRVKASVITKVKGVTKSHLGPGTGLDQAIYTRIWDVADYVVPPAENGAFFVATNVIITVNQTRGNCPEDHFDVKGVDCQPDPATCHLEANSRLKRQADVANSTGPISTGAVRTTVRPVSSTVVQADTETPTTTTTTTQSVDEVVTQTLSPLEGAAVSTQLSSSPLSISPSAPSPSSSVPAIVPPSPSPSPSPQPSPSSSSPSPKCLSKSRTCKKDAVLFKAHGPLTGSCVPSDRPGAAAGQYACEVESWCPIEIDQLPLGKTRALMAEAAEYTVFVKNSVSFPYFGPEFVRNNLISNDGRPCLYKMDDPDPGCQIFKLGEMVQMAGGNFTKMAIKGGVVALSIRWRCNLDYDFMQFCLPQYSFRILDDYGWNFRHAKYHEENRRTLYKMYGIKFIITIEGRGGKFNLKNTILNIGSGLALLGVTTVVCDFLLMYIKERRMIKQKKFTGVWRTNKMLELNYCQAEGSILNDPEQYPDLNLEQVRERPERSKQPKTVRLSTVPEIPEAPEVPEVPESDERPESA